MKTTLSPYDGRFDDNDRKALFGERLRQIRQIHEMRQEDVCEAIGLKLTTYSSYENGKAQPSFETLVRLSYLFDCSTDLLLQRENLVGNEQTNLKTLLEYKQETETLLNDPRVQEDEVTKQALQSLMQFFDAMNEKLK